MDQYKQLQTYKGWFYVLCTIVLIYTLVRKRSTLLKNAINDITKAYSELQATYEKLVEIQEELENQKKINENIFKDANVIIQTWNKEGQITRLNPFGQKLLGYTEEEVLSKKWIDIFVQDENRRNMADEFENIQNGIHNRNNESHWITKDDNKIDVILNNSFLSF